MVGLEIKREFTVGRLATWRAAALPIAAALGGMIVPALVYLLVIPAGPLTAGWGTTISTDTAFAVALIVLLGDRVPVDLRVFFTAAVIVDDLVAIAVVALFYAGPMQVGYLVGACAVAGLLVALERAGIYRALPYALLGVVLWACLHEAGLHPTLAGVILALVTPTRPPPNLHALMAQAQTVIEAETRSAGDAVMRHGPSEPALRTLDAVHDRIESPASKLLRSVEPWSSYAVLPVFALANAGVVWAPHVVAGHGRMLMAIGLGLVLGKPIGIFLARAAGGPAPPRREAGGVLVAAAGGGGALGGIGFTMSLFIAGQAFPPADFAAAKIGDLRGVPLRQRARARAAGAEGPVAEGARPSLTVFGGAAAAGTPRPLRRPRRVRRMAASDMRIRRDGSVHRLLRELHRRARVAEKEGAMLEVALGHAYEGLVICDRDGIVVKTNQAYAKFLGRPLVDIVGKHVTEVIENTRMHIVAKTGVAEIAQIQRIRGHEMICSRIPILEQGKLVAVVGKIMFKDVGDLFAMTTRFASLKKELEFYKSELNKRLGARYSFEHIVGREPRDRAREGSRDGRSRRATPPCSSAARAARGRSSSPTRSTWRAPGRSGRS